MIPQANLTSTSKPAFIRPHLLWPGIVLGLLLLEVGLSFFGYYMASADKSFAVETDYYRKAEQWDNQSAEQRAGQTMGWQATLRAQAGPKSGVCTLVLDVLDRSGKPLKGATVKVMYFHHARAALVRDAVLSADGDHYTAELTMARPGLWEFRYMIEQGGHAMSGVVQQDIDTETQKR